MVLEKYRYEICIPFDNTKYRRNFTIYSTPSGSAPTQFYSGRRVVSMRAKFNSVVVIGRVFTSMNLIVFNFHDRQVIGFALLATNNGVST